MVGNSEILEILEKIEGTQFHILCDTILGFYDPEYNPLRFNPMGRHPVKVKSRKGTPDSYLTDSDGRIIAFQYTTVAESLGSKIQSDIEAVISWKLANKVKRIVIGTNHRYSLKVHELIYNQAAKYALEIDVIWLEQIMQILTQSYDARIKAGEVLEIKFPDELSILRDFKIYYENVYIPFLSKEITEGYHQSLLNIGLFDLPLEIEQADDSEIAVNISPVAAQRILLIGASGSGKSTFLSRQLLTDIQNKEWYTVFLPLSNYHGEGLAEKIKQHLELEGYMVSASLIDRLLVEGRFNLLFDGFDETSEVLRETLLTKLNDHRIQKNCILVSSRPNAATKLPSFYRRLQIKDLSADSIWKFLTKTLGELPEHLFSKTKTNSAIVRFLSNPFHLVAAGYMLQREPEQQSALVASMDGDALFMKRFMQLIWFWNEERLTSLKAEKCDLENLFRWIAFSMTEEFKVTCTKQILYRWIASYQLTVYEAEIFPVTQLAYALTSIGILKVQNDEISFTNKIFQDYLTGEYLQQNQALLESKLAQPEFLEAVVLSYKNRLEELIPLFPYLPSYVWEALIQSSSIPISTKLLSFHCRDYGKLNSEMASNILVPIFKERLFEEAVLRSLLEYCSYLEDNYGEQKKASKSNWQMFHPDDAPIMPIVLFNIAQCSKNAEPQSRTFWNIFWEIPVTRELERVLATRLLHSICSNPSSNQDEFRKFYIENLTLGSGELKSCTIMDLRGYFSRWKDHELFEMLSKFKNRNILLDSCIQDLQELVEDIDYDVSDQVEEEIVSISTAIEQRDWEKAASVFSLFSEYAAPLQMIADGIRERVSQDDLQRLALVALQCPDWSNWEWRLENILEFISDQQNLSQELIFEICKYCRYTPQSQGGYRTHLWSGVRLRALNGLCSHLSIEKIEALKRLYLDSETLDFRLFFLFPLEAAVNAFETTKILEDEIKQLRPNLQAELGASPDLKELIMALASVLPAFQSHLFYCLSNFWEYLPQLLKSIVESLSFSYFISECCQVLSEINGDYDDIFGDRSLDVIFTMMSDYGNTTNLQHLKSLSKARPSFASEVAKVRQAWLERE